jgi:hypothetical protein
VSFYADPQLFKLPPWNNATMAALPMAELFEWQWTYWIHEDVLEALALANTGSASVIDAPVKHLLAAAVRPESFVAAATSAGTGAAAPGAGGSAGGSGSRPGKRNPGGDDEGGSPRGATAGGAPVDPRREAPLDFTLTFTGRKTNPLYDVRYVSLSLVVDPVRLPVVIDALARRNFITVVGLELSEADPFDALPRGFYYGSGALARVEMTLETVWLRSWTKDFMPAEVRAALGIAPERPAPDKG